MKYLGSKNRHSKELLPIILHGRINEIYVEPFVGGANMIDKVSGPRIGADIDPDLMALWDAVSQGWMPPEKITEKEYNEMKTQPPSALKGYAAFAMSFGGKKFGGWSRGKSAQGNERKYDGESFRNACKQFPKLIGVEFKLSSYLELDIPDGSIIYCDPPYAGTTKYSTDFDHRLFWNWCREKSVKNKLYVSEYVAPDDFECLWEKKAAVSIASTRKTSPIATERLFRIIK